MTDNFFVEDLIRSIRRETTMERYLPLAAQRDELLTVMRDRGVVRRDDVTDGVLDEIGRRCGDGTARLFARFIHIYDFKKEKLREIGAYEGTEQYAVLADLLRLPGVRILRARLYADSGVTLRVLAERTTEEIQGMVRACVERDGRTEIVPLTKEVNCHHVVAAMILRADACAEACADVTDPAL